jgi:hypothetical protein
MPFDDTAYRRKRAAEDPTYVEKRRAASLAWKARHVAKIRAIIEEAKNRPCVDCGKQYHPCCMEFDHVRGTKDFGIAKAARRGVSVAKVRAEIAKCEIRCVLCHRMKHLA